MSERQKLLRWVVYFCWEVQFSARLFGKRGLSSLSKSNEPCKAKEVKQVVNISDLYLVGKIYILSKTASRYKIYLFL